MKATVLVNQSQPPWPEVETLVQRAALAALTAANLADVEIGVWLTDDQEIQHYNKKHRGIDRPTNVLTFALNDGESDDFSHPGPVLLGDILLAYETIMAEAQEQNKSFSDHLTHLVVHGVLHLLGYDHERSLVEANRQEEQEVAILAALGIGDPYA